MGFLMEVVMEKVQHIMFCYTWRANGESGNGSNILQNKTKELTMKDINEAVEFIQIFIEKRMSHSKKSIQVIMTNIIHLNYCSYDDFYNNKEDNKPL